MKHVNNKIGELNTAYKRKKKLKKNTKYVEPIEKAIGQKWRMKLSSTTDLPDHTISHLTFQYIPLLETIKNLLTQKEFRDSFFEFNSPDKHICQDDVCKYFCCSDVHKKFDTFKEKLVFKLRLAVDDFDVRDPVKTKSVIHKLTGVYFTIDNMPEKYLSKTKNLFLLALCETSNLKAHFPVKLPK